MEDEWQEYEKQKYCLFLPTEISTGLNCIGSIKFQLTSTTISKTNMQNIPSINCTVLSPPICEARQKTIFQ